MLEDRKVQMIWNQTDVRLSAGPGLEVKDLPSKREGQKKGSKREKIAMEKSDERKICQSKDRREKEIILKEIAILNSAASVDDFENT